MLERLQQAARRLGLQGPRARWAAILVGVCLVGYVALFFISGGGQAQASPDATTSSSLYFFLDVIIKLAAVLLLIAGGAVLLRRWKVTPAAGPSRQMQIRETLHINPRQAIHLVQVSDKVFLVGATDQNITMLGQVDAPVPTQNAGLSVNVPAQPFSSFLPPDSIGRGGA